MQNSGPQTPRVRHRRRSNEVVQEASKANGIHLLVNDQNKYRSMLIRAYSSVWMIGGFAFVIYMGHLYITAMIVVIQIFMAKELFILLRRSREDSRLPGFRMLNWHFFFTAMLFVYGRILSQQLVNTVTTDMVLYKLVSKLVKYHMIACYALYITGFVWFIVTLKKKMYKYQFGQYAWTHMILIVVFTQSSFTVANIFEGIFWFLLPATLIVINDIAAYFFGFFFGRTQLIKLSPKKTWEGFIGASFTTMISAFVVGCQDVLLHLYVVSFWLACVYVIVPECLPVFCFGEMEVDLYSIHALHNSVWVMVGYEVYFGFLEIGIYGAALYAFPNSYILFAFHIDE